MIAVTTDKISIDTVLEHVEDNASGGVVLFLGRVRNHNQGRTIKSMDYEAYPEMARTKLAEIETEVRRRWPVKQLCMVHRTGSLAVGEVSVAVAIACSHRKEAFEACRFAIDTLKKTVPIWKKEYLPDGEAWVEGVVPDNTGPKL